MIPGSSGLLELFQRFDRRVGGARARLWLVEFSTFAFSTTAAFLLRFDFSVPSEELPHLRVAVPVWLVAKAVSFWLFSLDRGWWRFVSVRDVLRITAGNLAGSLLGGIVLGLITPPSPRFPRSVYLLDFLICLLLTGGIRVAVRMIFENAARSARQPGFRKRILIYGSGAGGHALLREIESNHILPFTVLGFLDDDSRKRGAVFHGIRVLGGGADLSSLAARHGIEEVLIALPSATGSEMTKILGHCHNARIPCKTVPGIAELIERGGLISQIREVNVEDLLGRAPVRLEESRIFARLQGQVVAVTGAAGSIGSELCRQIARFGPQALVIFDISETGLFHLERELVNAFPGVPVIQELGSIQDLQRVTEIFDRHSPSIVYHAAAYKHVPVLESHVFQAVENNVFGTWNVANAAERHGTDMVMISSDKAVRPTNVMGATKRVAELLVNAMPHSGTRSRFVSVRFGNVLGSNGSVVPAFKQQIAAGGPVTVTHPEMERYFMTIPEAAQLVLQASTMGKGGEIFVLDMGEPVRIVDLANNLILLSGLQPDKDIRIIFTGMRPGEKLREELSRYDEGIVPTSHEKIVTFSGTVPSRQEIIDQISVLRECCETRNAGRLILTLKELVPDYNPSAHVLQKVLSTSPVATAVAPSR